MKKYIRIFIIAISLFAMSALVIGGIRSYNKLVETGKLLRGE